MGQSGWELRRTECDQAHEVSEENKGFMEMPFMSHAGKESGYILDMSQKSGVRMNSKVMKSILLEISRQHRIWVMTWYIYWSLAENG